MLVTTTRATITRATTRLLIVTTTRTTVGTMLMRVIMAWNRSFTDSKWTKKSGFSPVLSILLTIWTYLKTFELVLGWIIGKFIVTFEKNENKRIRMQINNEEQNKTKAYHTEPN